MNNKDILNVYLLLLKSSVEVYVHGTIESSNKDIRCILHNSLDEILDSQARTYDEMVSFSFYKVDNVKTSDIKKVYDKLEKNSKAC